MNKLLLYASLLLLTQCSKCKDTDPVPKEPDLPAETQTGAGTLGCKVNGKVFAVTSSVFVGGTWGCVDCFYVGADTRGNGDSYLNMYFSLSGSNASGAVFQLLPALPSVPPARYGAAAANTNACNYDVSRLLTGQVTLTRFDGLARVASGRFAFTLYKPGCDTLRVTDGRFDVRF